MRLKLASEHLWEVLYSGLVALELVNKTLCRIVDTHADKRGELPYLSFKLILSLFWKFINQITVCLKIKPILILGTGTSRKKIGEP